MRQLRVPRTIHADMVREKNGMYTRQKETCKRDQQKKTYIRDNKQMCQKKRCVSKKMCQQKNVSAACAVHVPEQKWEYDAISPHIHEKRPISLKRDLCIWKVTYYNMKVSAACAARDPEQNTTHTRPKKTFTRDQHKKTNKRD